MAELKFSIVRHIGVLSGRGNGWLREVNLVKWNDGEPKLDIRDWSPDRTAMRKGLTFNRQEFFILMRLFKDIKAYEIADGTAIPATQVNAKAEQAIVSNVEVKATETIVETKEATDKQPLTETQPDITADDTVIPFDSGLEERKLAVGEN